MRPGDIEIIGSILHAVGLDEWWEITSAFFRRHPEFVGIAHDSDGRIGGYYVAVAPGNAPAGGQSDVRLGPWLRYMRETLRTDNAVLWRGAVDLTGNTARGRRSSAPRASSASASSTHGTDVADRSRGPNRARLR